MLKPLRQSTGIVAHILIAELLKQADRLRSERSRRTAAVDDDREMTIGNDLGSAASEVSDRNVQGAGDVRRRKRFWGQHVEQDDAVAAERTDEFVTRHGRHGPIIARRTDCTG